MVDRGQWEDSEMIHFIKKYAKSLILNVYEYKYLPLLGMFYLLSKDSTEIKIQKYHIENLFLDEIKVIPGWTQDLAGKLVLLPLPFFFFRKKLFCLHQTSGSL